MAEECAAELLLAAGAKSAAALQPKLRERVGRSTLEDTCVCPKPQLEDRDMWCVIRARPAPEVRGRVLKGITMKTNKGAYLMFFSCGNSTFYLDVFP